MTVRSLLGTYWSRNHFAISIKSANTNPQYDYKQTFFTAGDYEIIESSAFDNAEIVTPISHWYDLPTAVADMSVFEFGVIDEVLIIIVHLHQTLTEDEEEENDADIAMRESLSENWW